MNRRWLSIVSLMVVLAVAIPGFAQTPRQGPPSGVVGQPLSIAQAQGIARQFLTAQAPGLVAFHIMEFTNNFYVAVKEKTSGAGAFELLIDRYTGALYPEPGPNMMWNTKYGHGWGMGSYGMGGTMMGNGGMMGGGMMGSGGSNGGIGPGMMGLPSTPAVTTAVTVVRARVLAQQFLDARIPGTKTDDASTFPGYYTLDVVRDGKTVGMLSVNAYSGQVWYHNWHGTFIQEEDLD